MLIKLSSSYGIFDYLLKDSFIVVVLVCFAVYVLIIKPLINFFEAKSELANAKSMVDCIVSEEPFNVYEQFSLKSEFFELRIGDKFYLDPNFSHRNFHKAICTNGKIGYISKESKFERQY